MQAGFKCYQKYNGKSHGHIHKLQDECRIEQCIPTQIKIKCSITKIIRIVNNLLKFNMFETALFCWLLKKSHLTFVQKLLGFVQNDLSQVKILNDDYQKRVFILLLLNGYYVKTNFIANGSEIEVDSNVLENVPTFRQLYKSWKPEKSIKNINLTEINKIYESWSPKKTSSLINAKVDYNKVVDKILFLSKTYNVSGNAGEEASSLKQSGKLKQNKKQLPNKKRKPNQHSERSITIKYCEQKDLPQQTSPMKNSNKMAWFDEDKNLDLNPLRRSTRGLNRSIFEIREDKDDMNPNESLFRSLRSQESDNNMLNSLRNTGQHRFFNMTNSLLQSNNQSIMFGNMFKSSLESDFVPIVQSNALKVSQKKRQDKKCKLKPTTSYDDLIK